MSARVKRIAFEDTVTRRSAVPAELGFEPFDVPAWFAAEGFVEGRDIVLEPMGLHEIVTRGESFEPRAREIVADRPDVIFVVGAGGPFPLFLKRITSEVPVVFWSLGVDPIRIRLVKSLRAPGGNVTGTAWPEPDVFVLKSWEILKELRPGARRIGVLFGPRLPGDVWIESLVVAQVQAAARLGLERVEIRVPEDQGFAVLEKAIRAAGVDLLDPETGVEWKWRPELMSYVERVAIPTVWDEAWVPKGGLVSLTASYEEMCREGVRMVARILRGAKPAELPIYQARQFAIALNLRTARAMKLEVPHHLLLSATRLVQ